MPLSTCYSRFPRVSITSHMTFGLAGWLPDRLAGWLAGAFIVAFLHAIHHLVDVYLVLRHRSAKVAW